jgi:hypothetical protein
MKLPSELLPIFLSIHSRKQNIQNFLGENFLTIFPNKLDSTFIDYMKTTVQLMPEPYTTSCVDYRKLGHLSSSDCIWDCIADFYINEHNVWPGSHRTEDSKSDLLMIEDFNLTIYSVFSERCKKLCGNNPECYKEYFYFEADRIYLGEGFEIWINIPSSADFLIKHSPEMQFEEFFCYIMSIVGLWFGFSIIMLTDICLTIFKFTVKIVNKYKAKFLLISNNIILNDHRFFERTRILRN